MTFRESGLQFEFAATDWWVLKYDAHRYFQIFSGAGLKGVDFMGIYQETQLVLVEVKNYRYRDQFPKTSYLLETDPTALAERVVRKIEDSLRAIRVLRRYYSRKWWFRTLMRLGWTVSFLKWFNKDGYFWYQAYQLMSAGQPISVWVWLESDAPLESSVRVFRAAAERRMASLQLTPPIRFVLASRQTMPPFDGLHVREVAE